MINILYAVLALVANTALIVYIMRFFRNIRRNTEAKKPIYSLDSTLRYATIIDSKVLLGDTLSFYPRKRGGWAFLSPAVFFVLVLGMITRFGITEPDR